MKKLLTTITLSALVGTSASNFKPLFTNSIVSHGFKSNQRNNKEISITNKKDVNPFINKIPTIDDNSNISSNVISSNGTIYLGTYKKGLWKSDDGIKFEQVKGLPNDFAIKKIHITLNGTIYLGSQKSGIYKSTDGITFEQVKGLPNEEIRSIASNSNLIVIGFDNAKIYKSDDGIIFNKIYQIDHYIVVNVTPDGTIYLGTEKSGLLIIDSLLKINKPNYLENLYNGIVYNSAQKIDIKEKLVASAQLDGSSITVPTTNLDIPIGEHNLILTLKDKTLASVFGGDTNTGQVTGMAAFF